MALVDNTTASRRQLAQGGKVFIGHGSSPVWLTLKNFLTERLKIESDEFNAESVAGISTTERLQGMLDHAWFAFLVMTGDDRHADGDAHARENVIHEVGLFQGRLGFERAIILLEDGCSEFSNIHGLTTIRFPKGNLEPAYERIRHVLKREEDVVRSRHNESWPEQLVSLPQDALQVWTASNLTARDSIITMTNTNPTGILCVNAYVYSPAGEIIACCSCGVAPSGVASFSCRRDLLTNRLTPAGAPESIVIKLVASRPNAGTTCNPSSVTAANVASGLRAWGKTYSNAETPFASVQLSTEELTNLTSNAEFIRTNGGGYGICRSCQAGAIEPEP